MDVVDVHDHEAPLAFSAPRRTPREGGVGGDAMITGNYSVVNRAERLQHHHQLVHSNLISKHRRKWYVELILTLILTLRLLPKHHLVVCGALCSRWPRNPYLWPRPDHLDPDFDP